jgi:hypothetical protein
MGECVPACPRCGAAVPIHHPRLEHLRMLGWRMFAEATAVNWCGHAQAWVLWPDVDGETVRLVPIVGEAA